jgi:membrane-bound serine protease (ClpP class)
MSPTEFIGLVLVVLAAVLFLLEIKVAGFGALGVCAAIALVAGLCLMLGMSALPIALGIALPIVVIAMFLATVARKARGERVVTGHDGMVGLEGRAETLLAPEGKVFVHGELWDAWSPTKLEPGTPVRVTAVRGLRLEVTRVRDGIAHAPDSIVPFDVDDPS